MLRRLLRSLVRSNRAARRARPNRATNQGPPQLEPLEDRVVPSCAGEFLTYSQGGWGGSGAPAAYLLANFAAAFPNGLQLGSQVAGAASDANTTAGNQAALFTTGLAINTWLPHGGPSGALGGDTVNPLLPAAPDDGNLAGQTAALMLSVGFDLYDEDFSESTTNLQDLVVSSGPFAGMTVQQVLGVANAILSGITTTGFTPTQAADAAAAINLNFHEGTVDEGYLECPDETLQTVTLEGRKFEDLNGNGADDSDPGIAGWSIDITLGADTFTITTGNSYSWNDATNTLTDVGDLPDGAYQITATVSLTDLAAGIAYSVQEVTQEPEWTQTFGNAGYSGTFTTTNTNILNDHPEGADFGNFENIDICGNKFWDHDADGNDDGDGDEGIQGLRMFLDGDGDNALDWVDAGTLNGVWDAGEGERWTLTDANGDYCFTNLGPGSYTVREDLTSLVGTWVQTTTNPATITVGGTGQQSGQDVENVNFGNVKLVGSGGLTIGFWGNKNGLALLSQADFAGLTALNLRNADGTNRDFTGTLTQNRAAFDKWLKDANATNMAYMLSAQLAATYLNATVDINTSLDGVQTAIASTSALVYIPGVVAHNPQGSALEGNLNSGPNPALVSAAHTVSIQAIIDAANAALGDDLVDGNADGKVVVNAGNTDRDYYEALKIVLDALNNSDAIVIA